MTDWPTDKPWVIFFVGNLQFAVSTNHVREMVVMPQVSPVPQSPPHLRGVINLRGQVLPVIDFRTKLGLKSLVQETDDLIEMLIRREQDHTVWLDDLEASVREHREFRRTNDPHACEFGKWYDNYKTDNRILESCLRKFDEPHKKIHSVAVTVKNLQIENKFQDAVDLIEKTKKNELSEMIRLFREARTLLREYNREIALVLELGKKMMVMGVDSVETIETFSPETLEKLPEALASPDNAFISGTGKCRKTDCIVQLIDIEALFGGEDV
jgi:purine-binding chemotaxis protein CheW